MQRLFVILITLVACKPPPSPEVPDTVLPPVEALEPLPDPHARERAAGEFEIISVYEYPGRFSSQQSEHVIGVDIDVSSRASIDLGAMELTDVASGRTVSAFIVYRLDGDGHRVGMHDPAYAGGSRFFVAFAVDEVPTSVRLDYWRMPLGEGALGVAPNGRTHPEEAIRVVAATRDEPRDWFQTHWLLVELENAARSKRTGVPFDCDGRVTRQIEIDGVRRQTGFSPRPPIVPLRTVLVEQRCWLSDGALPAVVAADAPEVSPELLSVLDELPDGADVLGGHWGAIRSLSFSRSGDRLAVGFNGRGVVWHVDSRTRVMAFEDQPTVQQVLLSPDGTRLVVAAIDHAPTLWNVDTGERVRELLMSGTPSASSHVRMSPTGQLFGVDSAIGSRRALTIWGTRSGAPALRIGPTDFTTWRFSPDGFSVLTCSEDGDARVWDLADGADTDGNHRCPLAEPPLRNVPAGAAPEWLLAEPLAAELATVAGGLSRIAFPIGPDMNGADRVVVVGTGL